VRNAGRRRGHHARAACRRHSGLPGQSRARWWRPIVMTS